MNAVPATSRLRASLYEIGLNSPEPAKLADFYSTALGYRFGQEGDIHCGAARDRRIVIGPGPAKTLSYAAFAVASQDDLDALRARLHAAGTAWSTIDVPGFQPGMITCSDPDGNNFRFGISPGLPTAGADPVADRPARIQHVVFASTGLDRLLAFFTNVIGFTLSDRVEDAEGGLRTVFLRCSHEHHSLALFAASENRLDHHCYEAAEWNLIRDWADHFARLRIPLKWGPGRHGPGDNLFLFVHDTDGNWLEISAELEQVAPDRPVGVWPHEEYTLNTWGIGLLRS